MSSSEFAQPIRLVLRPSPRLLIVAVVLHLCAALALFTSAVPWLVQLCVTAMLLLSLREVARRHGTLDHPRAVRLLAMREDGRWTLGLAGGDALEASLLPSGLLAGSLVVLCFRAHTDGGKHTVVLTPDRVGEQGLRRLRARLRTLSPVEPVSGGATAP